ncbi:NET1-associated nuclear protein 1 [Coemansia erecta]|uniref:NET1-associated nuclear protein 1 n=1 Tax=Coemansia erecta TaxID=147472 RepID=A0A9W7XW61_9FUNG|nr:NET1-associated nuclear protein 1 [Coemansia erecta]
MPADTRNGDGAKETLKENKKKGKRAGGKTVRIQEPESATADKHDKPKKTKKGKRPMSLDLTAGNSDSDQGSYPMTPMTPQAPAHVTHSSSGYRKITQTLVSGGSLTDSPVVFSADSQVFFLAKDNAVAVYNVQNGEMVQNFSTPTGPAEEGRPSEVHAIVCGRRAREVFTFSADRRVRLWDGDQAKVLAEWALEEAAVMAVADGAEEGAAEGPGFFCAVRRGKRSAMRANPDKARYAVVHVHLLADGQTHVREVFRMAGVVGLAAGQQGAWVGAYGKFRVQLAHVARAGEPAVHLWHLSERVSTLAFHPSEACVAVGDWRGRIVQWFCLDADAPGGSSDRRVAQQPMHWHARRVNSVVFAGAHVMLSGGDEGVLVEWQLATGARTYLSSLGSEIAGIAVSPDASLYALTMRDNTVRVVAAGDRALVALVQGLKYAQPGPRTRQARRLAGGQLTSGLVVHPTTHALALGGVGQVQLFSHTRDRHVASIEVAPYTRVGGTLSAPHVDLVQFSADGTWMATVDSRPAGSACFLKFWRLDARTQQYRLATRVDMPHGGGGVRALAFQPGDTPLCVTAGRDGYARVWWHAANSAWTCRATLAFRGLAPGAAVFSADGSTLAVAFGAHVTLWDAQALSSGRGGGGGGGTTCSPAATLLASAVAAQPRVRGLLFVAATPYLVSWSAQRLDVWNMLTGSVWWTLAAPVHAVSERMGVVAVAAQVVGGCPPVVLLVEPGCPQPLATVHHKGGVEALALVPAPRAPGAERPGPALPDALQGSALVVLTPAGLLSVYAAEPDEDEDAGDADAGARLTPEAAKLAGSGRRTLGSVFARADAADAAPGDATAAVDQESVRRAMRLVRAAVKSAYVDAPHHVLPPAAAMFAQFATAQLLPRADQQAAAEPEDLGSGSDGDGDDDAMDVDDANDTTALDAAPATKAAADFAGALQRGFAH